MVALKLVECTQLPIDCRQCTKDHYSVYKLPAYTMQPTAEFGNFPFSTVWRMANRTKMRKFN